MTLVAATELPDGRTIVEVYGLSSGTNPVPGV
jgi:hypothetical protein